MFVVNNIVNCLNEFGLKEKLNINDTIIQQIPLKTFITLNNIYNIVSNSYINLVNDDIIQNQRVVYKSSYNTQNIYVNKYNKMFYKPEFEKVYITKKIFTLQNELSSEIGLFKLFGDITDSFSVYIPSYFSTHTIISPDLYEYLYMNIFNTYYNNIITINLQDSVKKYIDNFNTYIQVNSSRLYDYYVYNVKTYFESKIEYDKLFDSILQNMYKLSFNDEILINVCSVGVINYILSNPTIFDVDISNLKDFIETKLNLINNFNNFIDNKSDLLIEIDSSRKFIFDAEKQLEYFINSLYDVLSDFTQYVSFVDVYNFAQFDTEKFKLIINTYNPSVFDFRYDLLSKILLKTIFVNNFINIFDDFVDENIDPNSGISIKKLFVIILNTINSSIDDYIDNDNILDFKMNNNMNVDVNNLPSYKYLFIDVLYRIIKLLPMFFIRKFVFETQ